MEFVNNDSIRISNTPHIWGAQIWTPISHMTSLVTSGTWEHDPLSLIIRAIKKRRFQMKSSTKLFTLFSLVILFTLVFVPAAYAFDGRTDNRIIIGKDEVINEDLYLGANEVIVDGTINGDLMAAGENVIINGTVTGDLFAAGTTVTINGSVGDDLFAAGGSVTLGPDAVITDDVFSAGAGVEAQSGSTVGGTFLMGAAQGLLSGAIAEDLMAGANSLRLEGTVGGDAKIGVDSTRDGFAPSFTVGNTNIRLPEIPAGLSFGDKAGIAGSLAVTSPTAPQVPASVTNDVTHSLPPVDAELARELRRDAIITSPILDALRRLVSLLLVGVLIGWLMPGLLRRTTGAIQSRPLPSLGLGLLNIVAAPLIAFTLVGVVILTAIVFAALSLGDLAALIVVVGFMLIGLAVMAFVLAVTFFCQAAVAYLTGRWILGKVKPGWNERLMWPLLLGLLVFGLLFAIPVAGGLLQFLVILVGLGAILISLWESRKAAPAIVETPALEA